MKTLIKKLKFGVLLTGLVILTSCGRGLPEVAIAGINAINRSFPSMAMTATKYTGNKISYYLMNSSAKNKKEPSVKKAKKATPSLKGKSISIGGAGGAPLVSSNNR